MLTGLGRPLLVGSALACFGFLASSLADEPAKREAEKSSVDAVGEARVAYLRTQMQRYQIRDADGKVLPLHESMGLRWTNPVSGVVDGGVFVWSDGECPVVVAKCYVNERRESFGECLQLVTDRPLVMKLDGQEVWKPETGLKFHLVEGEKPSATANAAVRLSQMRQAMRRLNVTSIWGRGTPKPWELRPLTAPVFRYQSESRGIVDGAIFAFTQGGTNPEAIGLVEIRDRDGERTCHIAVTRLSSYGLKSSLDDKKIVDLPQHEFPDIKDSFFHKWTWFKPYPFPKTSEISESPAK